MAVLRSSLRHRSTLAALAIMVALLCVAGRFAIFSAPSRTASLLDSPPDSLRTFARLAFWYAAGAAVSWPRFIGRLSAKRPGNASRGWRLWAAALGGLVLLATVSALVLAGIAVSLWLVEPFAWLSIDARAVVSQFLVPLCYLMGLYSPVGMAFLSMIASTSPGEAPRRLWASLGRAAIATVRRPGNRVAEETVDQELRTAQV